MKKNNLHQAVIDAKAEMEHNFDDFEAALETGSIDSGYFMSIAEIEKKWSDMKNKTTKIYSDIISAYLSDLSEADMIKAKKATIPERG